MTAWPALFANSTTLETNAPQIILTSIHGRRLGIGATGGLISEPGLSATSTSVAVQVASPVRVEARGVNSASTADTIGNYGAFKLTSTSTAPTFTIAEPVAGCEVDLQFSCTSSAVKIQTSALDATFTSSATSLTLNISSSIALFLNDYCLTLQGLSTGAYKTKSFFSLQGSTILPTGATG